MNISFVLERLRDVSVAFFLGISTGNKQKASVETWGLFLLQVSQDEGENPCPERMKHRREML